MSGHSKWANIKRKKGLNDAIRSKIFAKLSRIIALSVSDGGGIVDPDNNVKLRLAIDNAKQFNMPKENIKRAIEHGAGHGRDQLKEVVYEGFAPHGVGFIIMTITDNPNRTYSEIRTRLEKHGGKLGKPGSVSYLFINKGYKIYEPNFFITLDDEQKKTMITDLIEALEELDDVQNVFFNMKI